MPTPRKITFLARKYAETILAPVNMISIGGAMDPSPDFRAEHKLLRLAFEDSSLHDDSCFDFDDAKEIIEFLNSTTGEVVVHCEAGMCRSAAVAAFAADKMGFYLDRTYPCRGTTAEMDRRVYEMLVIHHLRGQSAPLSDKIVTL